MTPVHDDELHELREDLHEMVARWEVPDAPEPGPHERSPAGRRTHRSWWWLAPALAAVVLVAVVAVINLLPLPRPAPEPAGTGDVEGGLVSDVDYSVAGALGEIPASALADRRATITTADLARAAGLNGAAAPATVSDGDAVATWTHTMSSLRVSRAAGVTTESSRVLVPLPASFGLARPDDLADFDAETGWTVLDLAAFVDVEGLVDDQGTWLVPGHTTVGLQADDDALANAPSGTFGTRGLPMSAALDNATVARPNGTSLSQRVDSDTVTLASLRDVVNDRGDPDAATLADDPALLAVAQALDDADVIGATLAADPRTIPLVDPQAPTPIGPDDVTSTTADAVGYGWSINQDGQSIVTIAMHLTDDQPDDIADAIAAAWSLGGDDLGDDVAGLTPWADAVDVTTATTNDTVTLTVTPNPDTSQATDTVISSTPTGIDRMLTALLDAGELPFATSDLSTALMNPPLEPRTEPVDPDTQLGIDQADIIIGAGGGTTAAPTGLTGSLGGTALEDGTVVMYTSCDGGWLMYVDIDGAEPIPPIACDGSVTTREVTIDSSTAAATIHKVAAGPDRPGTWAVALTPSRE